MGLGAASSSRAPDWAACFGAAALEPERWGEALTALAEATGSDHAQLLGIGGAAELPFNWISGMGEDAVARFAQIEGGSPRVNYRIAADLLPDMPAIVHEPHYAQARPLLASEDYLDFCADYDIPHGCQTRLVTQGQSLIGFALLRSRANGLTDETARRVFAEAAVHARAAVLMQRAVEHQGFALLTGTMEAMDRAAFLLDGLGEVKAMTPAAGRLLGGDATLRLAEGRLTSARAAEARRMDRAMRALFGRTAGGPAPVVLREADGPVRLVLEYFALPRRDWAMNFAPRAMIVVRERAEARGEQAARLSEAFGFTPAEAEVALGLANGIARGEIARRRGVSGETLKAQIRSLYAKAGCGREAELVHLVQLVLG